MLTIFFNISTFIYLLAHWLQTCHSSKTTMGPEDTFPDRLQHLNFSELNLCRNISLTETSKWDSAALSN
jgi:hypothetical protein